MTDMQILMNAQMVQATLREIQQAGTGKSQTRRLLDPQPKDGFLSCTWNGNGWDWVGPGFGPGDESKAPSFHPGMRLWVREAWQAHSWASDCVTIRYRAEEKLVGFTEQIEQIPYPDGDKNKFKFYEPKPGKWRPSLHMPRWASRITLEVTDVRVQRLQEISEADAWAEGCKRGDPHENGGYWPAEEKHPNVGWIGWNDARMWFSDLWDGIYQSPEKQWDANPWVVAITFRPHLCNIDKMEKAG
ncbi:hypothetical protein [Tritonibacter mobilis]|uniref:hypothetical protein n=1 Tax=Tritonibacter mobilis TaxID=379347 RepID=UPI000806A4E7|nr:hypothetical protein [Tritonibacter mobilis]